MMINQKGRFRKIVKWFLWIILAQTILINISAALYAYKLTHLLTPTANTWNKKVSKNIFAKTWRLFVGPDWYRYLVTTTPPFAYSTVSMKTKSGIPIEAWYAAADTVAKGTVILFHGLMGNKGMIMDEAIAFHKLGYNIFLVDVRNHGNSGGRVTTVGYKETEEVKLAYDHVVASGEKKIVLWGGSLGAVEIVKAVSDYQLQPSALIAEIPFLSLESHLKGRARILGFPEQPFGFLTAFWIGVEQGFNGLGFMTTKYAANIDCPVLLQFGEKDELVLEEETNKIYAAIASSNKRLVKYDDAGHGSLLAKDPKKWMNEVGRFLQ